MIYIRSKFAPKHKDKLVHRNDIQEKMALIEGSDTDYITPSGIVYADYDNNMFYPKYAYENKHNHYMYVNVRFSDGKVKRRRQHIASKSFYF